MSEIKKKPCIKFDTLLRISVFPSISLCKQLSNLIINTCPCSFDIKSKQKSSDCGLLSITCTEFENKVVLSLSYKLQRSSMLFHKVEMYSFSKKKKKEEKKRKERKKKEKERKKETRLQSVPCSKQYIAQRYGYAMDIVTQLYSVTEKLVVKRFD